MYKAAVLATALAVAAPLPAQAQCYQGCAAILGFFGGLFTGAALAQPRVVVVPGQPVYAPPNYGMATSNGCVQQLVGYDQWGRAIMQFVCR
jgi:hypothetical protein